MTYSCSSISEKRHDKKTDICIKKCIMYVIIKKWLYREMFDEKNHNVFDRYFVFYPLKHRGLGDWISIKYDEKTKTFSKEYLDTERWHL